MAITPPIDIRVEIAPDAEPDGDPADWVWLDITEYRRQAADIEINVGRDDEASQVEAGDSSLTLDLRDGLLSPRNPLSALYGRIGVNTPIRYRLPMIGYDDFERTSVGWSDAPSGQPWVTGASYNAISDGSGKVTLDAPHTATLGILSGLQALDVDVVYSVSIEAVTTGAPWISAVHIRRIDDDNLYRVNTELKPSGAISTKITRRYEGSATDLGEDLGIVDTYSADAKVWTRAQALGPWIRCKVWTGVLGDEPDEWNVSVPDSVIQGTAFAFYQWRFIGNTNVGDLTVSIDDLVIDAFLWEGNVPEWPPTWDKSGNDSTVPLVASGPLRRLSAGDPAIKSPLTAQLGSFDPALWLPVEDAAGSDQIASGVPGGSAATIRDITLSADADALAGASNMGKIDSTSALVVGRCLNVTYTEWSGMVFYKFPSVPGSDFRLIEFESAGTVRWWQLYANGTGFYLLAYDEHNTLLTTSTTFTYAIDPTRAFSIQLEMVQSGGDIDWVFLWNQVGEGTFYFNAGSTTGTCGRPLGMKINGTTMTDALFGHIWMGPETLPYVDADFLAVSSGFAGETARARAGRLADQAGVPLALFTGVSEPLGRQQPGQFLGLLRDTIRADLGTLLERAGTVGYIPRGARYNAPVAMALDWAGGDLAEAPHPTDDDQRLRNQWTISRTGGSEATGQRDWGANSVARRGIMPDSDEVNIQLDERLVQYVGWYLNLTAYDDFRWPVIEIDLVAHPELIPAFLACRVGSRITVANPKSQVPGITIDLLIEGIKQSIGRHRWDVAFSCSPALPWDVAVYDDPLKRMDSRTSVLAASYGAGDTTLQVGFDRHQDRWSQINVPYLWAIAGETITVDEMSDVGAVGLVSGQMETTAEVALWVGGVGGTPVRSSGQAKTGTYSALVTVAGSPASVTLRLSGSAVFAPVTPGLSYTLSFWIYSSAALGTVNGVINWYNGGSFVGSSGAPNTAVPAEVWTHFTFTATAPGGVDRAQYGPSVSGSPADGTLLYFDAIELISPDAGFVQTARVTRNVTGDVAKSQAAGTEVHIHPSQLARYAL